MYDLLLSLMLNSGIYFFFSFYKKTKTKTNGINVYDSIEIYKINFKLILII